MTAPAGEPDASRQFDAVLCDLDGVLRNFDADVLAELERRHGVEEGTLAAAAFAEELLQPAVTGEVSDDEWRKNVAVQLLPTYGIDAATDLVAEWSGSVGAVDADVRALLAAVRGEGVSVALVSNATTRLEGDLVVLGIADDFDVVVSSARLGVAKPEPAFFFAAAQLAEAAVGRCLYVDDTKVNVDVAQAVGMQAHLFESAAALREALGLAGS